MLLSGRNVNCSGPSFLDLKLIFYFLDSKIIELNLSLGRLVHSSSYHSSPIFFF